MTGGTGAGAVAAGGGVAAGGAGGAGGAASGGAASGGNATGGAAQVGGGGGTVGGSGGDASGGSGGGLTLGPSAGACTVGAGTFGGEGNTQERYLDADVTRDDTNYMMIANGWGQNWESHDLSWLGTSLAVNTFEGSRQSNGAPAGYPTVFCGRYSNKTSGECGLPAARSALGAINTSARWSHPDGNGVYNVAYDVWMGSSGGVGPGGGLQSYFMVWLRDPETEGPAGTLGEEGVSVEGVEGSWNIVAGTVNGLPIVNYVRAEGDDAHELAFDMLAFVNDAQSRNLEFPGEDVLSVAIGFEIWQGPVTNLVLEDFCVDVD